MQVVDVPAGGEMLKMARTIALGEHEFEGTPSRDSLRYISIYGIEGVKTLVRGLYKHKVLYIWACTHLHTHLHMCTYTKCL